MDFGLREWLIVIGLLVIAGILFDGWRRMGGRSRIRFKLERNPSSLPDAEGHDELLGPVRVVSHSERAEPTFGDGLGDSLDDAEQPVTQQPTGPEGDLPQPPAADIKGPTRKWRAPAEAEVATVASKAETAPAREAAAPAAPDEVLIINVAARNQEGFSGAAMLQSIMESGLRFGEMDIFHRHESMSGNGDVLFSMANALKPGTFDPDELEHSQVRAVSFFMSLPGPRHPKQALDLMIASARKLAQELHCDLKDESRSVLTAQTIEHYRQRIAEYERKRLGLRR